MGEVQEDVLSTRHLAENTRNLIISYLKSNLPTSLSDERAANTDGFVNLEPPQQYFIYPKAKGYKTPAIFVIVDEFDFRPQQKGANHINATVKVNVSITVEEQQEDRLTVKCDRYFDALHETLAQASILDSTTGIKLIVIVQRASFSPVFIPEGSPESVFRKEALLECEVEHYSNF